MLSQDAQDVAPCELFGYCYVLSDGEMGASEDDQQEQVSHFRIIRYGLFLSCCKIAIALKTAHSGFCV